MSVWHKLHVARPKFFLFPFFFLFFYFTKGTLSISFLFLSSLGFLVHFSLLSFRRSRLSLVHTQGFPDSFTLLAWCSYFCIT